MSSTGTYTYTYTYDERSALVRKILTQYTVSSEQKDLVLITCTGGLGAGKTSFVQALGELCGVMRISSPTYAYVQAYPISGQALVPDVSRLIHFDLYRLSSEDAFFSLGFEEHFSSGALICIEWPEKIKKFLERFSYIAIDFAYDEQNIDQRVVSVTHVQKIRAV